MLPTSHRPAPVDQDDDDLWLRPPRRRPIPLGIRLVHLARSPVWSRLLRLLTSRWMPVLALPLLVWLSYLTLQGPLAEARTPGGLSHVHPPLWMLLLWGVTVLDALSCYALYLRWQAKGQRSTLRGSAHWATGRELAPYLAPRTDAAPLVLGTTAGRTIALSEQRQCEHVLLVGPQGKGKGVYVIVPSLLREPGTRSIFAIDPKSELVRLTAGAVAQHHQVWVFAPDAPATSVTYNPLAHIHTFEDAQDFATCWVTNTGVSSETFYNHIAETFITSAVLHLREAEPDAPFARLAEVLVSTPFDALVEVLQGSPATTAREVLAPVLAHLHKNPTLQASIHTGLANRFLRLFSPSVQAVTERNEVDFTRMAYDPTALYLAIPASASERLRPLSACLLMQMFATWMRLAEANGGQLPHQVVCYLDEFGNAGVVPHFAERIATLRSFRVSLLIALQSFAQLYKLYGKDTTNIILSNAATHLVLHGVGAEEADYYSKRIGDTTLRSQSQSGSGYTQVQEVARPLIRPEEVRTLPAGQLLVLADHAHPVRVQGKPYYRDKTLASRANLPLPLLGSWPTPYSSFGGFPDVPADPDAMTSPGWEWNEEDPPAPPTGGDEDG
ncbi:MAG TPA: type IV secretory system conjugative DNA transfer family protein [Ktedonobacterales bacterium]|nr:type IV secretory system conjugative DNA transfer family protein [Ktedonobacterales bacterium]